MTTAVWKLHDGTGHSVLEHRVLDLPCFDLGLAALVLPERALRIRSPAVQHQIEGSDFEKIAAISRPPASASTSVSHVCRLRGSSCEGPYKSKKTGVQYATAGDHRRGGGEGREEVRTAELPRVCANSQTSQATLLFHLEKIDHGLDVAVKGFSAVPWILLNRIRYCPKLGLRAAICNSFIEASSSVMIM